MGPIKHERFVLGFRIVFQPIFFEILLVLACNNRVQLGVHNVELVLCLVKMLGIKYEKLESGNSISEF